MYCVNLDDNLISTFQFTHPLSFSSMLCFSCPPRLVRYNWRHESSRLHQPPLTSLCCFPLVAHFEFKCKCTLLYQHTNSKLHFYEFSCYIRITETITSFKKNLLVRYFKGVLNTHRKKNCPAPNNSQHVFPSKLGSYQSSCTKS